MNKEFELKSLITKVQNELGKTEWIDVYSSFSKSEDYHTGAYFSAFVKNDYVEEILKKHSWDLMIGNGKPGFITHWSEGNQIDEYRNYNDDKVYPIVINRYFPALKTGYIEPLQEFCHYFDLFEDKMTGIYYSIDDCGDKIEAIKITEKSVKIKLKLLKEFATVKQSSVVLFFEAMNFEDKSLEDLGLKEASEKYEDKDLIYSYLLRDCRISKEMVSQSWLLGKKIIHGLDNFKPDYSGRSQQFENYIIGTDDNGEEMLHNCDKDKLADFFGKNEGKPDYLTPVCFKKEVLKKYYDNPKKYTVDDGSISAFGLWNLRIDNNLDDYIVAFLGDLGDIPHKEQLHWKQYNVVGERKLSHTTFQRAFMCEFSNPEQPDLFFKYKFENFQIEWQKKYGYCLFLPLKTGDSHYYNSLHSPLNEEVKEFEEQILGLTKILVDSINEKEIYKAVKNKKDGDKGIDKLEKFVCENIGPFKEMIDFFRNLYKLRSSGIAHRKGDGYDKVKEHYKIEKITYKEVFDTILMDAIKVLNTLEAHFLKI